jgi:hypothetical protein
MPDEGLSLGGDDEDDNDDFFRVRCCCNISPRLYEADDEPDDRHDVDASDSTADDDCELEVPSLNVPDECVKKFPVTVLG